MESDCCCYTCCECCGCAHLRRISKGEKFCCCCPLVVGVWLIGGFIYYLAISLTIHAVFLFFNQYLDGYYPAVYLILTLPVWAAAVFFYIYTGSDTKSGRNMLWIAIFLSLGAILLIAIWDIVYIIKIYDQKYYYDGMGDADVRGNYRRSTKSDVLIGNCIGYLVELSLLIYFVFAIKTWKDIADKE